MKKRANGKGSAIYLGDNRDKPWGARITIGKDINGVAIRHYIDKFKTELEALVCLENYHKTPYPLYIQEKKYNRIVTFSPQSYPLISVSNPDNIPVENNDNYTFKQVYEAFKKVKLPNSQELKRELDRHIKNNNKYGAGIYYSSQAVFKTCTDIYDRLYKNLKTSDFQSIVEKKGTFSSCQDTIKLFRRLDKFALQERIIQNGFAQYCTNPYTYERKRKKEVFTYEQIKYLWNINTSDKDEEVIRDLLIISLYTGMRLEEILFIYTKNIFLDKNYMIAGLKTTAGKNREIPIHKSIISIIKKYYNIKNEFLFMNKTNTNRMTRINYKRAYKPFMEKHEFLNFHTAHECRHTLRTELKRLNVKDIIINSILGHKNGNVGDDVYTHISLEEKIEAINLIKYDEKNNLTLLISNQ